MRFRPSKWIIFNSLNLLRNFTPSIACAENEFSVSVLNTTVAYCIKNHPCSGTYSAAVIGSCPQIAECAIIPHSLNVMGCVQSDIPGITYIRPDGSTYTTDGSVPIVRLVSAESAERNGMDKQTIPVTQIESSELIGEKSNKIVKSTNDTDADRFTRDKLVMPQSSKTSALNDSNTVDQKKGTASTSIVIICVLVVIGLSIAAVVAGVRLLRNKKNEAALAEAGEQNFGFGCVTPKDKVVLL